MHKTFATIGHFHLIDEVASKQKAIMMQENLTDFSIQKCMGNCTGNVTIYVNISTTISDTCYTIQTSFPKDIKGPLLSSVLGIGVNLTSAIFTVILNIVLFIAMNRKEELKTAANLILKSMAASDFLVGLIAQPLKIVYLVSHIADRPSCLVKQIDSYFGVICVGVSLFNICLFALDRCFATVLPYRYLEESIYNKYLITVLSGWILLTLASVLTVTGAFLPSVLATIMKWLFYSCMVLVIVSYVIIYKAVRAQRLKITSVQMKFHSIGVTDKMTPKSQNHSRDSHTEHVSKFGSNLQTLESGPVPDETPDQEVDPRIAIIDTESASNRNVEKMPTSTSLIMASNSREQTRNSLPALLKLRAVMPEASEIVSPMEEEEVYNREMQNDNSADGVRQKADGTSCEYKARNIAVLKQNARNYTVLLIVAAFILCYLPGPILKAVYKDQKRNAHLLMMFDWTNTLVMLNSAINPLIYCWRVSTIRREAKQILQRILCCTTNNDSS